MHPLNKLLFKLLNIYAFYIYNDATKRLSSVRYFSSEKLQEETSLLPHEKIPFCIATGTKTDKGQSQKLHISVFFVLVSKLGLHPELLQSSAYIIKLLKITTKMTTGLLIYVYFLLYAYLQVLCSYRLVF